MRSESRERMSVHDLRDTEQLEASSTHLDVLAL
jgi:hypothetical protein